MLLFEILNNSKLFILFSNNEAVSSELNAANEFPSSTTNNLLVILKDLSNSGMSIELISVITNKSQKISFSMNKVSRANNISFTTPP